MSKKKKVYAADFATDAAAAAFGADGTFRSAAVLPGDGDGDPGGGGDGDTGWGAAWSASDLEEAQLEEAQLAQRMENCSMDYFMAALMAVGAEWVQAIAVWQP